MISVIREKFGKKLQIEKERFIEDMPGEDKNNENDKSINGAGEFSEEDIEGVISETA